MSELFNMDDTKIVISEFYENNKINKYKFDTDYQRECVWSEETKSFFIDSILKNFPIPPVFLYMEIDDDTGKASYEVVDGKQRLTTIIDFIEGRVTLPDDFGDDKFGDPLLNGGTFDDLNKAEKYKKQFWRYSIPVILVDTKDRDIIKNIFDRLNRNGEPLMPQELRKAKYGSTELYALVSSLSESHCWKSIFDRILAVERQQDDEFTSELLFFLLENKILKYTSETLDKEYDKWTEEPLPNDIASRYSELMSYITGMNLDYDGLNICKISHLYAIWVISHLAHQQGITSDKLGFELNRFYKDYSEQYKNAPENTPVFNYRLSLTSNTKGVSSRKRRIDALRSYLITKGIEINDSEIQAG